MKARHIQFQAPAAHGAVDDGPFCAPPDVAPNSSAIVGVTVSASLKDVLAVVQTAALFASNFRGALKLDLPGKDTLEVNFGGESLPTLPRGLLDSVKHQLKDLVSVAGPGFIIEAQLMAATFISEGSIAVRLRSANAVVRRSKTLIKRGNHA